MADLKAKKRTQEEHTRNTIVGAVAVALVIALGYLGWWWVQDAASYTRYTNDKEGISIRYPRGWTVIDHPPTGAIVVFQQPKANALQSLQENWNISTTSLVSAPLTLEQYVDAANKQVTFMFHDVKPVAEPCQLSGHRGYKLFYRSPADDGLVLITWVFIYRDTAYNITYITTNANYADPREQQLVNGVIRSLKVLF